MKARNFKTITKLEVIASDAQKALVVLDREAGPNFLQEDQFIRYLAPQHAHMA